MRISNDIETITLKQALVSKNACAFCKNDTIYLKLLTAYLSERARKNEYCFVVLREPFSMDVINRGMQKSGELRQLFERGQIEISDKRIEYLDDEDIAALLDLLLKKKAEAQTRGFSNLACILTHHMPIDNNSFSQYYPLLANVNYFVKAHDIHKLSIYYPDKYTYLEMLNISNFYFYTLINEQTQWLVIENTQLLKSEQLNRIEFYKKFSESLDALSITLDLRGQVIASNERALEVLGYTCTEIEHLKISDIIHSKNIQSIEFFNTHLQTDKSLSIRTSCECKDGRIIPVRIHAFKMQYDRQTVIFCLLRDISHRLKVKRQLMNYRTALEKQNVKLQKAENALRGIIDFIPKERNRIKNQIQTAIEQLLLPLLEKLKSGALNDTGSLSILENTIKKFTVLYGGDTAHELFQLTHKELEICNMIRQGFSTKDIAGNLHLSTRTVENHRNNIRKKLGISQNSTSLSCYLRKMTEKG